MLQFIDYRLGAPRHPQHIEIRRQARSAQLEVELSGSRPRLERPLFASEKVAYIHNCSLGDLEQDKPHSKTVRPI